MKEFENLVSIQELQQQINASKLFSIFLSKEQRKQRKEIEEQLNSLLNQMRLFSERFSPLGWCMYDSMSVPLIEKANQVYETGGAEAAEHILIDYYKGEVKDRIHQIHHKSKELLLRYELIKNAFEEHFAERYYASVPLFLIIVDGAVNDFTKSKGLFAEGTEVTAWDCLVGCNDSLENIKNVFNKGRGKTNSEEIRMPYRNGILHGRDLNYGNEYVSCKCVALLFAVAEWMAMKNNEDKRKEKYQKEHEEISLTQTIKRYNQVQKDKQEIQEWKKKYVVVGKDIPECGTVEDYENYQYIVPVIHFLQYWKNKNYGILGMVLKNMFSYETSEKKRAGEARKLFENKTLNTYKLLEIEERGCGMSKVVVNVTWGSNGEEKNGDLVLGVSYVSMNQGAKETALPWKNNGEWVIYPWDVSALYKE